MAHKDIPTRSDIEALAAVRQPGCVSIYLPSGPLPEDGERARIELKNKRQHVLEQLDGDPGLAETVAGALDELIDDVMFWQYQGRSLAVLVGPDILETFRLPNRLTGTADVADRFYLKPLTRAITFAQSAHVLALAQNSVRLVRVSADLPAAEVDVDDLPSDLRTFTNLDVAAGRGDLNRDSADPDSHRRRYCDAIGRAIQPVLHDTGLPLVLAAAEPLASIYRHQSAYPHLLTEAIPGNPEALTPEELASRTRPILDDLYAAQLEEVTDLFEQRAAHGLATADLASAAKAAVYEAIETLLVDIDQRIPGYVDPTTGEITLSEEDDSENYGVVDEIVRRALLTRARIFAVRAEDMPRGAAVAALLRFEV